MRLFNIKSLIRTEKKPDRMSDFSYYLFVDLLGFNSSLLPGVFLLSRRLLSTSPVESAIGFGPGLSGVLDILVSVKILFT